MKNDLRWQRAKKHLVVFAGLVAAVHSYYLLTALFQPSPAARIGMMGVLLLLLVSISGYTYNWRWTGLGNYTWPKQEDQEVQRSKTLWDWMGLLIVPVVLAVGGLWFSHVQSTNEQRRAEERAELEQQLADDNQREVTLQTYLDQMAELLLDRGLRTSSPGAEVREIARIRTLTVLRRLDSDRRTTVFNFLHDAELLSPDPDSIIDFAQADLSGVDLSDTVIGAVNLTGANLEGATLTRATLINATLTGAYLQGATLTHAYLGEATLTGAYLDEADLTNVFMESATLTRADLTNAALTRARRPPPPAT